MPITYPYKFSDWYGYDKDCVSLTAFLHGNPSAFAADMCNQLSSQGTYYHDGSGTYPVTGDIVYVDIDTVGDSIDRENVFGTIEAVKTVSDLFMPVSGTVSEQNEDLTDNPQLINESPYDKGWIIKIKNPNMEELKDLLSAEEYKKELGI